MRTLNADELRRVQAMHEPELHDLRPETSRRIREAEFRWLQPCQFSFGPVDVTPLDKRPRIKMRMIVRKGVHVGYQVFTEVHRDIRPDGQWGTYSLHSYIWF